MTRRPARKSRWPGTRPRCQRRLAGPPRRCSRPRPTASSARWSSRASTPRTCPTRPARCARSTRRRSSSRSSCGPARSPTAPTWSSRSPTVAEKAGTFVNWEGRGGTFAPALSVPGVRTDLYVLGAIADEMDVHLGLPDAAAARAELAALGAWQGARPAAPAVFSTPATMPLTAAGTGADVRLATWAQLIDAGRMQDGEPYLAGTARPTAARTSAATAHGGRRRRRRQGDRVDRGGLGDRPARGHRHGRGRGVAAHQQLRQRGPRGPRCWPRQQGDPEEG